MFLNRIVSERPAIVRRKDTLTPRIHFHHPGPAPPSVLDQNLFIPKGQKIYRPGADGHGHITGPDAKYDGIAMSKQLSAEVDANRRCSGGEEPNPGFGVGGKLAGRESNGGLGHGGERLEDILISIEYGSMMHGGDDGSDKLVSSRSVPRVASGAGEIIRLRPLVN